MVLVRSPLTTLRRVADALLIAVIVVVLFGVMLGRIISMTGRETFIIGGGSMEPGIPLGAAVVTEPVPPADLAVGDVVSLRTGPELERTFTHRITRLVPREDGLWVETKGDANEAIDPSITPARQVIGRVIVSIPHAGYLLALLSVPSGVLLVLLVAGCLLVLTWLLESFEIERVRRAPVVASPAWRQATRIAAPFAAPHPAVNGVAASARATEIRSARARRARRDVPARGRGSMATTRQASPTAAADRPAD